MFLAVLRPSTIQQKSITEINYDIRWIVIYLVDSAIQRLNNWGQADSEKPSSISIGSQNSTQRLQGKLTFVLQI